MSKCVDLLVSLYIISKARENSSKMNNKTYGKPENENRDAPLYTRCVEQKMLSFAEEDKEQKRRRER